VLCSPTTAGLWQGMPLPWNTSDRQKGQITLFCLCYIMNCHVKVCADVQFTL
jgi:hypothetical protein